MASYRWTKRVTVIGGGFLALLVLFAAATRILNVEVAGVQPEAWALTATMTAPLTLGTLLVAISVTAVAERSQRHRTPKPVR